MICTKFPVIVFFIGLPLTFVALRKLGNRNPTAGLATKDSISLSQITEARSEFLQLMGDIPQPNFCKAVVVCMP